MQIGKIFYPPLEWDKSDMGVLTMKELVISNRELELLYQEAKEHDFLMGKTPVELPDNWEEEE